MKQQHTFFCFLCIFCLQCMCFALYVATASANKHLHKRKATHTMQHLLNNTNALIAQHATHCANAQLANFAQQYAAQHYAAQYSAAKKQYYIFDSELVLCEGAYYVAANTSTLLQLMQALNTQLEHFEYFVLYLTQAQYNAIVATADPVSQPSAYI